MRDQRDLTQDAVLRAQIATATKLIAEQSVAFARAHSAIERAIESLREPDGEGPSVCSCRRQNQTPSRPVDKWNFLVIPNGNDKDH
jgi:hypothetical protein